MTQKMSRTDVRRDEFLNFFSLEIYQTKNQVFKLKRSEIKKTRIYNSQTNNSTNYNVCSSNFNNIISQGRSKLVFHQNL